MINTQYINLNMTPSGVMPVLYVSQYDVGRPLGMVVYNGGEAVDLSTYTVTIEGTRTDGTPITAAVTTDGNIGGFATTATMTNKADCYQAKMVIADSSGNRVASLAFVLMVTPKTMDENAESIEEDKTLYQQYTEAVQALIAEIREDLASLSDHVDVVEDALNSTPFMAERIFRKVLVRNAAGESSVSSQAITNTGNTIICAGRTLPDDSTQIINEYDLSGNLIRTQAYANADLGHMNDITYDADRGLLYVAGTGAKVVAVRYSDLMVVAVHTITNIEGIASLDYDNGILYAGGGKTTGVIDLDTWAYVIKITYDPAETNQNYSAVRQGMAAHDGYIYLVYNWTNQLIKINATTWEVERSILIGKGNGEYPYGEVEGVTFVGRQMYLLTAVWFGSSYTHANYEGGILQVFKTNVGGSLVVHDRTGQATGAEERIVYVNESSSDSTALNPNGTLNQSFYSLLEACAFINYQAEINKNWTFSLQINRGDQHDYSKDVFVLTNMTVYVRAQSGVQLRELVFRNCVVFLRQIDVNYIDFSYSIARIYGVTATRIRSYYTVLYKSLLTVVDDYDMEGTTFFPLSSSDTENISKFVTSEIPLPLYVSAEVTSEYLMGKLKLDRYGRNAVLSYDSTFTIPAHTETTICTLPAGFRPVRSYAYDLVDSPSGAGGEMKIVRVYLDSSGTVRFYNYNDTTEFANMRLLIPYITKHMNWSLS